MRSLIYLFAILTGLTVAHAGDTQIAAPVAVNAAQAMAAADQQTQAAPAILRRTPDTALLLPAAASIAIAGNTPSRIYAAPVFLSDRARQ